MDKLFGLFIILIIVVIVYFLDINNIKYQQEFFNNKLVTRKKNPKLFFSYSFIIPNTDKTKPWTNRKIIITVPLNKKQPRNGWPYLVYYSFMKYDGSRFKQDKHKLSGIFNLDLANECHLGGKTKCQEDSSIWIQLYLQLLLYHGIAIVETSMVQWDSYFYLECDKTNKKDINDIYSLCWNGYNPDRLFLEKLFDKIYLNDFNGNFKLNYHQMGVMGYSVGAQMVSRSFNDFPLMKTHKKKVFFPTIRCGVMISGGSLHCYQYCNADPKSQLRGPKGKLCQNQPSNYQTCYDSQNIGCCPIDLTEPNYDQGLFSWDKHPPTLLIQTKTDNNADPNASIYYYNILKKNKAKTQIITGLGSNHNMFPTAIIPGLDFVKKYLL